MQCTSAWHRGGYQLDHVVRGNTNADVLKAMEHDPDQMLERLRLASEAAIRDRRLAVSDARRLINHVTSSLQQSTYLQA